MRITCGSPDDASARMYPPLATPSCDVPSSTGMFCRVSASPHGPDVRSRIGLPRARGLGGVAGAHHREPGDGAQRGHVLDRLVGGAVLAEADRVVRPDVDDRGPASPTPAARRRACSRRRSGTCRRRGGSGRAARCPRGSSPSRARGRRSAGCVRRARPSTAGWRCSSGRTRAAPPSSCCCSRRGRPSRPRAPAARRPARSAPRRRPCAWTTPFGSGSQDGSAFSQPAGS